MPLPPMVGGGELYAVDIVIYVKFSSVVELFKLLNSLRF